MNKLVIVESPFAGDIEANIEYAHRCMKDCFERGEIPFASHLLYTQFLNDNNELEREQGIEAGMLWGYKSDYTVVYTDRGISKGMQYGIDRATKEGRAVVYRKLDE